MPAADARAVRPYVRICAAVQDISSSRVFAWGLQIRNFIINFVKLKVEL